MCRTWASGGAAVLLILFVAVSVLWRRGVWRQTEGELTGGPRHPAALLTDHDEIRAAASRARLASAAGRLDEAFDLYRSIDGPFWAADDCFTIGSALIERDRIGLGWSALEAARRIDPGHAGAKRAIEVLQGKLATTSGRDRATIHEAARRLELLRSVPGGPPLGLIALGLARFAKDSDQEGEFLDRLALHDRAVPRAADSIAAATRLVARLLLEAGRAREGSELLENLVAAGDAGDGHSGADTAPDREAAWLLSRAALQLDRHRFADAMLARAAGFGKLAPISSEPAPFVGSKRCGECHGKIYHEQQDLSRHALTLRSGTALRDVPLPAKPIADPISPNIKHGFTRKGDDLIEMQSSAGSQVVQAVVEYAVGSGRHGITMIARDMQGSDRELRVSYFAAGESWGETKGIDSAPYDASEFIGAASRRACWISACRVTRPGTGRSSSARLAFAGRKATTAASAASVAMDRGSTTSKPSLPATQKQRSHWARTPPDRYGSSRAWNVTPPTARSRPAIRNLPVRRERPFFSAGASPPARISSAARPATTLISRSQPKRLTTSRSAWGAMEQGPPVPGQAPSPMPTTTEAASARHRVRSTPGTAASLATCPGSRTHRDARSSPTTTFAFIAGPRSRANPHPRRRPRDEPASA